MIRAALVLSAHSFARFRGVVFSVGLVLAAFQFLLTQVAVYLVRNSAFDQLSALLPEFVRSAAGPSALAFMSFTGIVTFGYFHPVVLAALLGTTIAIATEPAAEVEIRFVDLTLARPVTRASVITRTVLLACVVTVLVLGMMVVGTWIGLTCCTPVDAPRLAPRLIASVATSVGGVMICWMGVALAIGVFARRRAVAGSLAGALALAAYLLDYLGRVWEPVRALSVLSPFHYFEPAAMVAGEPLSLANMLTLAAIGTAGTVVAYIGFARRDI